MSADTLEAIGERHNLRAGEISPLEDVGIFNAIYLVGSEYILRIPRDAISQPVTRYLCDFGQARSTPQSTTVLTSTAFATYFCMPGHDPLRLDPSAG